MAAPAPAGQSTRPRVGERGGWGRGPPGGQETDQDCVEGLTLSVCCAGQQRVSALFQGTPGLPTKAFYPQKWFLLLSAREALREWVSPCSLHGASTEWTQEGQPQNTSPCSPTCLQAPLGACCGRQCSGSWGAAKAERAAPGPHLGVHSPDWADRKSRKQRWVWGEMCGQDKAGKRAPGQARPGLAAPGSHGCACSSRTAALCGER